MKTKICKVCGKNVDLDKFVWNNEYLCSKACLDDYKSYCQEYNWKEILDKVGDKSNL
ncbi:hypothetical protein [Metamycoplasma buccale]|uniref:hypothetical protein n=1 Tax=Metamycoplasma buccale TaxID=55602 RepID=UPI00398EDDD9